MRNLGVWIEIGGLQTYVGRIIGEKEEDARFSYAEEYLSGNIARPISIHLPLSENAFSVDDTRNFFEGLLPEGFTRRCQGFVKNKEPGLKARLDSFDKTLEFVSRW